MRKHNLVSAAVCLCFAIPIYAAEPAALALIHVGLAAQGGETRLRALRSVQWEANGYRNELEQSERPEGPYIVQMNDITEVHDLSGHRYLSRQMSALYPVARFTNTVVVSNQIAMRLASSVGAAAPPAQPPQPGTPQQVQAAQERMALSPERLLLPRLMRPTCMFFRMPHCSRFPSMSCRSCWMVHPPPFTSIPTHIFLLPSTTPGHWRMPDSGATWEMSPCGSILASGGSLKAAFTCPFNGMWRRTVYPTACL